MTSATSRLSVTGLTKRFGGLVANDDISLDVAEGELHCLLGENGAGKSTLSSCLYGLYQPDAGEIWVDGRPVDLRSPADALRAGIGMVHQHFVLVPGFTALENIAVGTGTGWRFDRSGALARVAAICDAYGITLEPHRQVGELSVGQQQWVEIVKVLYTGARLVILDEPTAVLTPDESQRLFRVIRRLMEDGISVLLITHKMAEVMQSDRVSVLRKGRLAGTVRTGEVTQDQLTSMMIGQRIAPSTVGKRRASGGEVVLSVRGLSCTRRGRRVLEGISFDAARGEIFGLSGVSGNGQDELFECLFGLAPADGGSLAIGGEVIAPRSSAEVAAKGVGYVPSDRLRDGLVGDLAIRENLVLGQQWSRRWRNGPFLDRSALDASAREAIAAFSIAASSPEAICGNLSGGNAQKVILAREFAKARRLLLCNQPTRGLDVGAAEFVRRELLRKSQEGCAILLASEELDDLFALCGRIAVFFRGRIVAILNTASTSHEEIGRLMAGQEGVAAA
jgi:simple sugar transport system ATP-binding protein